MRGESVTPGVDPAHRERQRRKRQRKRTSDMAGAEQIDGAREYAERFSPAVIGKARELALAHAQLERTLNPSVHPEPRADRRRGAGFGDRQRQKIVEIASVKRFDAPFDPPATALAELGAERERTALRRPTASSKSFIRRFERRKLQRPAADRAVKATRWPHHHTRARLARARTLNARERHQRG